MSANNLTAANRTLAIRLNQGFFAGIIVYLLLFAGIFYAAGQPLYILIAATAAVNVGAVLGFLYSTFGDEEEKFSKIFVVVNGALGGAALTDLLKKDDSLLLKFLEQITIGCGLGENYTGLVFLVITTCVPIGFFLLYFNRKLFINPEIDLASKRIREANELLNQKPLHINTDPDMKGSLPDPEVAAAAKVITESSDTADSGSVGTLLNLGRSFYELKDYKQAIPFFEKVLKIRPNQPEALLAAASARLELGQNGAALTILEKLTSLPIVPTIAWKLLGYAYLFYPDNQPDKSKKLETAVEASRKYVAFKPDDWGAKLNLACAYGQLGPDFPNATEAACSLIKEILANNPGWKQRIKDLTGNGQDFAGWTQVKEFMQLLD